MAPKDQEVNTSDVLQAQIDLSMSKVRDIVSSWFPPPAVPDSEIKSHPELDDSNLLRPTPPRLGLGAPIPTDWVEGATKSQSNDLLRRTLMGSSKRKVVDHRPLEKNRASTPKYKQKNIRLQKHSDSYSESEEEAGRSGLGRCKRPKAEEMSDEGTEICHKGHRQTRHSRNLIDKHEFPSRFSPAAHSRPGSSSDIQSVIMKSRKKKKKKQKRL